MESESNLPVWLEQGWPYGVGVVVGLAVLWALIKLARRADAPQIDEPEAKPAPVKAPKVVESEPEPRLSLSRG